MNHDTTAVDYDILSQGSAWPYLQFGAGNLPDYYKDHDTNAGHLQMAIWALEDEVTFGSNGAGYSDNPYLKLAIDHFNGTTAESILKISFRNTQSDYPGNRVYVINVFDANGGRHQDLVGVTVPDGGLTAMLLGLGLGGLALFSRKFRQLISDNYYFRGKCLVLIFALALAAVPAIGLSISAGSSLWTKSSFSSTERNGQATCFIVVRPRWSMNVQNPYNSFGYALENLSLY